jgi:hypothetical protein
LSGQKRAVIWMPEQNKDHYDGPKPPYCRIFTPYFPPQFLGQMRVIQTELRCLAWLSQLLCVPGIQKYDIISYWSYIWFRFYHLNVMFIYVGSSSEDITLKQVLQKFVMLNILAWQVPLAIRSLTGFIKVSKKNYINKI